MTHHEALTILGLRDAVLAALDALAQEHPQDAQRRLRAALAAPPPALRAELQSARAVVRAAQTYAACVDASEGAYDPATETAYHILTATLTISARVGALFSGRDEG